jgi:hypothetical protein
MQQSEECRNKKTMVKNAKKEKRKKEKKNAKMHHSRNAILSLLKRMRLDTKKSKKA